MSTNPYVPIRIPIQGNGTPSNYFDLDQDIPTLNGIENNAYTNYNTTTTPPTWVNKTINQPISVATPNAFNNSISYNPTLRATHSPSGNGTYGDCSQLHADTFNTCHPGRDKSNLPTSVLYSGNEICTTNDDNMTLKNKHDLWMNCRNNRAKLQNSNCAKSNKKPGDFIDPTEIRHLLALQSSAEEAQRCVNIYDSRMYLDKKQKKYNVSGGVDPSLGQGLHNRYFIKGYYPTPEEAATYVDYNLKLGTKAAHQKAIADAAAEAAAAASKKLARIQEQIQRKKDREKEREDQRTKRLEQKSKEKVAQEKKMLDNLFDKKIEVEAKKIYDLIRENTKKIRPQDKQGVIDKIIEDQLASFHYKYKGKAINKLIKDGSISYKGAHGKRILESIQEDIKDSDSLVAKLKTNTDLIDLYETVDLEFLEENEKLTDLQTKKDQLSQSEDTDELILIQNNINKILKTTLEKKITVAKKKVQILESDIEQLRIDTKLLQDTTKKLSANKKMELDEKTRELTHKEEELTEKKEILESDELELRDLLRDIEELHTLDMVHTVYSLPDFPDSTSSWDSSLSQDSTTDSSRYWDGSLNPDSFPSGQQKASVAVGEDWGERSPSPQPPQEQGIRKKRASVKRKSKRIRINKRTSIKKNKRTSIKKNKRTSLKKYHH